MSEALLSPKEMVPFWRPQDVVDLGFSIPILVKSGVDQRGKWPGGAFPPWGEIHRELAASRAAFLKVKQNRQKGLTFITLLTGRFVISATCSVSDKSGQLWMWLNKVGIEYASNRRRSDFARQAVHITHDGIFFVSPDEFRTRFEERGSVYRSRDYLHRLMEACNHDLDEDDDGGYLDEDGGAELSHNEEQVLRTLETFVEGEFELEQQIARSEPGYTYVDARPEPRKSSIRQFYRLRLVEDDFRRIRESKPTMLVVEGSDGQEIFFQVEDLDADTARYDIVVSTVKQMGAGRLAPSGMLKLAALDTLRKVRSEVLANLRKGQTPNPWLVGVAADNYRFPKLEPVQVRVPSDGFPPNPSQLKAINAGAGTPDCMLVLGPPGTGKTTVIYTWVEHFIAQGKRVLISSQSNMAVNNVLERVAKNDKLTCVRIGNESKVSSTIHNLLIDNCAADLQKRLLTNLDERMADLQKGEGCFASLQEALRSGAEVGRIIDAAVALKGFLCNDLTILEGCLYRPYARDLEGLLEELERSAAEQSALEEKTEAYRSKGGILTPVYRVMAWWTGRKAGKKLDRMREITGAPGREGGGDVGLVRCAGQMAAAFSTFSQEIKNWQQSITTVRQESLYPILLRLVDVVGATCIGINTNSYFKDVDFDVVIIDESGQIQLHNLIVPLCRAPQAILVGDHKQLPPVVQDELKTEVNCRAEAEFFDVDTNLLDKSWFEVLWDKAPEDRKVMLDTQFRCPSLISDYISEAFYENRYYAGEPMKKKQPLFSFCNSTVTFIDTSRLAPSQREEQSRRAGERNEVMGNKCETALVLKTLQRVLAEKPELGAQGEIGIIVPYANHVQEIQKAISREQKQGRLTEISTPVMELVASVDSYQGQERDLIIFTFTRSNARGSVGFLADWRRLNVAMTRAKGQLIMIGDFSTLTKSGGRPDAVDSEFKVAMQKLQRLVKERGHLVSADAWHGKEEM
ncbi:AAA domain-containing protein [Geomonas subterranea]|uniref:AAA domain-containing protein n=1 Tax=Geomonas subterranea TaxID=2847989 RepID=UPI001CD7852C|nr:AAA domain-containing protein [Geomonas fuzhouensis]